MQISAHLFRDFAGRVVGAKADSLGGGGTGFHRLLFSRILLNRFRLSLLPFLRLRFFLRIDRAPNRIPFAQREGCYLS